RNKAIVGANAFAHESGIHQDGMLKDARTYQIMDPAEVGALMTLPLGKHSGRHAFARACADAGLDLDAAQLSAAFVRFKTLADANLVGVARDAALKGLAAELDLRARVARVRTGRTDVVVVTPFGTESEHWAVERAFRLADARRGSVTAVGVDERWRALVDDAAERHAPTVVEHVTFANALVQLAPAATLADVVLAEAP